MNKAVTILLTGVLYVSPVFGQESPVVMEQQAEALQSAQSGQIEPAQPEEARAEMPPQDPPQDGEPLVYSDRKHGFTITAPEGWMMYQGMRRHKDALVVFSRLPYGSMEQDNPRIVVSLEKAKKRGPATPFARACRQAEVIGLMKNLPNIEKAVVLEAPEPVENETAEYARFSYEVTERKKRKKVRTLETVRSREYVFHKDGMFFVLSCGCRPEFFDKYTGDFQETAGSFRFTKD